MVKCKVLTEMLSMHIVSQLLVIFEYLHAQNILYRDLKPENVLIDDIDTFKIKLVDYGLAKILNTDMTSSFCGSTVYMSPEMLSGNGHDYKLDIYSLGALLYEMVTGLPPFYSRNTTTMFVDILQKDLHYPASLSPQLVHLLKSMLHKDPKIRMGSISEVKSHAWFDNINWEDVYS